jgi:hypothetical protein
VNGQLLDQLLAHRCPEATATGIFVDDNDLSGRERLQGGFSE